MTNFIEKSNNIYDIKWVYYENIFYGISKGKVNNRAKCLAISQVTKAESYNSCLLFIYNFFYYVVLYLTFSFLLILVYTIIWAHIYICFRA
jgi:hypothetical protein